MFKYKKTLLVVILFVLLLGFFSKGITEVAKARTIVAYLEDFYKKNNQYPTEEEFHAVYPNHRYESEQNSAYQTYSLFYKLPLVYRFIGSPGAIGEADFEMFSYLGHEANSCISRNVCETDSDISTNQKGTLFGITPIPIASNYELDFKTNHVAYSKITKSVQLAVNQGLMFNYASGIREFNYDPQYFKELNGYKEIHGFSGQKVLIAIKNGNSAISLRFCPGRFTVKQCANDAFTISVSISDAYRTQEPIFVEE